MIAVTVLITSCQVSTLGTTDSVGTHNTTTSTQIVKNQPLETHSLVCVANPSKLACIYFFDGMTITTISVRMEKNKPRIPQPSGFRPFVAAMIPHTTAAMMLPIATNMPLMPRRMNPAASG